METSVILRRGVLLMLVVVMFFTVTTQAAVIELDDSGWAMVITSPGVSIPFVYGVTDDAVYIEIDKSFDEEASGQFLDPIIFEFQKISEDAVGTIVIRDEYVVNNTGVEWVDYHIFLVVDALDPEAGFDPQYIPDGDELEEVYYSKFYGYDGLPIQLNFADTDGSGVASFPVGEDIFWPGNGSGQIVIVTNSELEVGERFGVKQVPTVPEPATVLMLGLGGLLTLRRKKRS